jgi:hypothetical protein
MTYQMGLSPTTRNGMDLQKQVSDVTARKERSNKTYIAAAHAAIFNLDVDVVLALGFGLEINEVEFVPLVCVLNAVNPT